MRTLLGSRKGVGTKEKVEGIAGIPRPAFRPLA